MRKVLSLMIMVCIAGVLQVNAGTPKTFDARQFFTPITVTSKGAVLNALGKEKAFLLQHNAAKDIFNAANNTLSITNFDIPMHGVATLSLTRTADVFDANTQFFVNTKAGKKKFTVHPIVSYKGTVEGEEGSTITLHYSDADLTGFIQYADGSRTTIGRDFQQRQLEGATPHVVSDENSTSSANVFANFICGNESLPVDQDAIAQAMSIPPSLAKGESMQAKPLLEMNLAIVLREDVDIDLRARGYNDEMIAQHFAKIVAAMSQAYEEDLRTRLKIAYFLSFTEEAPSGYINDGSDPGALLDEFSLDWSGNYSQVSRTIAHLYTNKVPVSGTYVGGIAYGGQAGSKLCVKSHKGGYGVSTIDLSPPSQIPGRPDNRNAFVWDVFVAAHEMGHNVGAAHTHSCYWSPPVDTCQLQSDKTDACYDYPPVQRRIVPGTIMSYCHLVNGSSTPLTFGTRVSERMRGWIENATCINEPSDPIVEITSPRGSENWNGGESITIKWVSAHIANVNLEYSANNGNKWDPIASNVPAIDSQYVWNLPFINTTQMWIRVSDASNASVNNVSIASYTVTSVSPLEMRYPVGGERIAQGAVAVVKWSKAFPENVNILFAEDGSTFNPIATNVSGTSYNWTVPAVVTSNAKIQVVSVNNSATATSGEFAIGASRFQLLLPAANGTICNDVATQYSWSADFIDRIKIQYSVDAGAMWKNALQAVSVDVYQGQTFSRASSLATVAKGTPAWLRVIDSETDAVLETRTDLTIDSCGAVTDVAGQTPEAIGLAVARIAPNPATTDVQITITNSVAGTMDIFLVDVSGAMLQLERTQVNGGAVITMNVPLGNVASGAYRLGVRQGSVVADVPLTIVR